MDQDRPTITATFLDQSGEDIRVSLPKAHAGPPTVRDWRTALANKHFLVHSFRWVLLVDSDNFEILSKQDGETLLAEEIQQRELHAVQRQIPEVVDLRTATEEQKTDKLLVLRAVEHDPVSFCFAGAALRGDREIVETVLDVCSHKQKPSSSRWLYCCYCFFDDITDAGLQNDAHLIDIACGCKCQGAIKFAPSAIRDNEQLLRGMIQFQKDSFGRPYDPVIQHASDRLRDKADFMLFATAAWCRWIQYASERLRNDRAFILDVARIAVEPGYVWELLPAWCSDDAEIALGAVDVALEHGEQRSRGNLYSEFWDDHISDRLRGDVETVKAAIRKCGAILGNASDELRKRPDLVELAVREGGFPLAVQWLDPPGRVTRDGALRMMRDKFHGYYNEIVEKNNPELADDRELAEAALRGAGGRVFFRGLIFDRGLVLLAASLDGRAAMNTLKRCHRRDTEGNGNPLHRDREVIRTAIQNDPNAFWHLEDNMRNDREIAFLALGLQRLTARAADVTISFSAEELTLRDGDIFERPELVHMVSGDLWGDLSLIRALIRSGFPGVLRSVRVRTARRIVAGDHETLLLAVRSDGLMLEHATVTLQDDLAIVLAAVHQNAMALEFASERLRGNRDVVMEAVRENGFAWTFAAMELQVDPEVKAAARLRNAEIFG